MIDRRCWLAVFLVLGCDAERPIADGGPFDADAVDAGPTDGGPVDGSSDDGSPGGRMDAAAPSLGTLAEQGSCAAPAGYACTTYEVRCPGVAPARVAVRRGAAEGAPRGVVVFGSGNRGSTFWGGAEPDADPIPWSVLEDLRAAGFITIERAWEDRAGGWFADAEGAGLTGATCRYATLLAQVIEETPTAIPVCAMGSSAGSVELSYALTAHGLGDRVRFALFSGGPLARVDDACTGDWDCEAATARFPASACDTVRCDVGELVDGIDALHGGACSAGATAPLAADSLATLAPTQLALPTALSFQWGDGDCLGIAQSGRAAAALFEEAGVDVVQRVIPGAGHSAQRAPAGGENIVNEVMRGCR